MTCAKLSEAEVMITAGITDVLIANQIVGARKIQRLVNLARHADIIVAVDSSENLAELCAQARAKGVTVRVLVEVNIGHNRCGVAPFGPVLALAREVDKAPNLLFAGIMGYDGHCTFKVEEDQRQACAQQANDLLVAVRRYVEEAGLEVKIVSAGGTLTYKVAAETPGVTEVQAGTYLLMDTAFKEAGMGDFECTLTVLATVISRPAWAEKRDLAVIDVGRKGMDVHLGLPEIRDLPGASVFSLSQEHGRVKLEDPAKNLQIADKLELWVRNANDTINLYDKFYGLRNGAVEAVWEIPARGKSS